MTVPDLSAVSQGDAFLPARTPACTHKTHGNGSRTHSQAPKPLPLWQAQPPAPEIPHPWDKSPGKARGGSALKAACSAPKHSAVLPVEEDGTGGTRGGAAPS